MFCFVKYFHSAAVKGEPHSVVSVFHRASVCGVILSLSLLFVPPIIRRASFVFVPPLYRERRFTLYISIAFGFPPGVERVLFDKFYSHTHLSIIIEVSVVGVPHSLAFLCQGELKVVYNNKLSYCEDPASVSCILPIPDSQFTPGCRG